MDTSEPINPASGWGTCTQSHMNVSKWPENSTFRSNTTRLGDTSRRRSVAEAKQRGRPANQRERVKGRLPSPIGYSPARSHGVRRTHRWRLTTGWPPPTPTPPPSRPLCGGLQLLL